MTPRRDPPIPRDGRCHVCRKPLGRLPGTHTRDKQREMAVLLAIDPFCSNICCRQFHGAPIPEKSIWGLEPEPIGAPR